MSFLNSGSRCSHSYGTHLSSSFSSSGLSRQSHQPLRHRPRRHLRRRRHLASHQQVHLPAPRRSLHLHPILLRHRPHRCLPFRRRRRRQPCHHHWHRRRSSPPRICFLVACLEPLLQCRHLQHLALPLDRCYALEVGLVHALPLRVTEIRAAPKEWRQSVLHQRQKVRWRRSTC